jgi:hypothetical protein
MTLEVEIYTTVLMVSHCLRFRELDLFHLQVTGCHDRLLFSKSVITVGIKPRTLCDNHQTNGVIVKIYRLG